MKGHRLVGALIVSVLTLGGGSALAQGTRTFFMGFSYGLPPSPDTRHSDIRLKALKGFADASIEHYPAPWDCLLKAGIRDLDQLAAFCATTFWVRPPIAQIVGKLREEGITVNFVTLDPIHPADRASQADELIESGGSLANSYERTLFAKYAKAVHKFVNPEYLGLAAEVNLIQKFNPRLYGWVSATTRVALAELAPTGQKTYVSLAAATAWNNQKNPAGFNAAQTAAICDDLFGAARVYTPTAVGLASYPQVSGMVMAIEVPRDFWAKVVSGNRCNGKKVIITELGWSSGYNLSSDLMEATHIRDLEALAGFVNAASAPVIMMGWLNGADMHPVMPLIQEWDGLFRYLGILDYTFQPKANSIRAWSTLFGKKRSP